MFDIGWSELVLIGVVALIVIGPKELPGVLRAVGHWTGKIRRMAAEFQGQFNEAMREAEMADLKKQVEEINDAARSIGRLDPLAYEPPKGTGAASPPAGESAPGLAAPVQEGLSVSAADVAGPAPGESGSPPPSALPRGEAATPETSAEPAPAAALSVPGEAGSGIRPA